MKLVTVHSKLITDTTVAAQIYYFIRSRDTQGSGWVRIGIKAVQDYFNRSRQSIKRWCSKAVRVGLFYSFEIGRDHLYVRYASIKKRNEITGGCFANARVQLQTLISLNTLKAAAYEAAIKAQQIRSEWAINRKSTKKLAIPLEEKPESRGDKPRSVICLKSKSALRKNGLEHVSEPSQTVFVRHSFEAPTASQLTLAANLGRCRTTIIKWVKDIEHLHVFQRVLKDDNRIGHRITVTLLDKRKRRTKHYLRRPNHYLTYIDARCDKRTHGSLPVLYRPTKGSLPQWVIDITSQKEDEHIPFDRQLTYLKLSKLRELADAILLRFKGQTAPIIQQLQHGDLVGMILKTKEQLTKDEFQEVQMFLRRLRRRKVALPPGYLASKNTNYSYDAETYPGLS